MESVSELGSVAAQPRSLYEAQMFPCYCWGDQVSVHRGTHEAGKLLGVPGVRHLLQLIEFPSIKNLESC